MSCDSRAIATLCGACVGISLLALAGLARGAGEACDGATGTLRVLCSAPAHTTDIDEPQAGREARLAAIASAIDTATDNRDERAMLLSLGWHESRWARYVQEGRCSDGPPGQRCDEGRSVGPWQQRAFDDSPVPDVLPAQALRALRLLKFGQHRCKLVLDDEFVGAFASYGSGGSCAPAAFAERRAKTARILRGRL
jgi:hypothetical protein